jgi:ADP-ribosylglycohydrolase
MTTADTQSRFRGCLLGLAMGDALGTTLEFKAPGTFNPISDIVGGGPFQLRPGYWTDDTSMALCLAESLLRKRDMDLQDQMNRYLNWYRYGYMSSTDTCFDIGNTVARALVRYEQTGNPEAGPTAPNTAGNGSVMRLAPVPMAFFSSANTCLEMCAWSSVSTHGARAAVDACRYYGGLIFGALNGLDKEELLSEAFHPSKGKWAQGELDEDILMVAKGSFKDKFPPEIVGSGYVVKSIEAALWAFYNSDNFREGCLLAANLGNDADTTAAIYGQLAGAYYGLEGLPQDWLIKLHWRKEIDQMAIDLHQMAMTRKR